MNELELELMRMKMRMEITERVALMSSAQVALREGQLHDIVDHMHGYLNMLRKARKRS